MSLIGCSCLILSTAGQWKMAIIRAASQPLLTNIDLTQIRVLVEWCEGGDIGKTQREWLNMTNPELFKSVYVEKSLLWARRLLSSEQNRAVAWPARAFTFLCGTPILTSPDMMIVEYFCDKEKVELFIHDTKELQLSEAKATLSQQAQMLHELNEWEETNHGRVLLQSSSTPLTGCRISVCNVQQPLSWISGVITSHNIQTKELTLVEDHSQSMHTVNPLMVHILLHTFPEDSGVPHRGSQSGTWQTPPPPLSLVNSPDVPPTNSPVPAINSPHITSPIIQECLSPHFSMGSSTNNKSPLSLYRSPSQDILPSTPLNHYRRSSLQQMNVSLMRSEPNLHRRCSLDPITLQRLSDPFDFFHELPHSHSQSLTKVSFNSNSSPADGAALQRLHSPHGSNSQLSTTHGSNSQLSMHGSNSQLSTHGSNSQLSTHGSNSQLSMHGSSPQLSHHGSNSSLSGESYGISGFPSYPTPEDIIKQTDRSKSLGNIFSCVQTQPLSQYYHRQQEQQHSHGGVVTEAGGQISSALTPSLQAVGGRGRACSTLQNTQPQKRRKSFGYGAGLVRSGIKKPRFEVLPTISDPQDIPTKDKEGLAMAVNKTLCRSASQPAVFPPKLLEKRLKQLTGGVGIFSGDGSFKHEDDLDILKQIIETDVSMHIADSRDEEGFLNAGSGNTQSLTHIPGQFSGASSLPSLLHAGSMHMLHTNYDSAPNFMQFGKSCTMSFENESMETMREGGRVEGKLNKESGTIGHDSHKPLLEEFQSDTTGYSGFSDHGTLVGVHGNQDGQNLSRRNSLYNGSQNGIETPVFTNDTIQNTSQGTEGPFDFAQNRNGQPPYGDDIINSRNSSLSAGGYDPSIRRWTNANSTASNSCQFSSSDNLSSVDPSSNTTGSLLGQRRGGVGAENSPDDNLLGDYMIRRETEMQCPSNQGEVEASERGLSDGVSNGGYGLNPMPSSLKDVPGIPDVATEAVVLVPSVPSDDVGVNDLGEFSISRVINRQYCIGEVRDAEELYNMETQNSSTNTETSESMINKGNKSKKLKKNFTLKENSRSRGRPRLTEEEKQRRKELRELGLMKRSRRRTKEQVAQWRAEKILSPAKRGRKPGSGKKNIIKTSTGKVVFVSLDLSQFANGTVLLQNGFCRAYPGVSKCLDCGTCEGDLPSSKYCRFLEFRKLYVEDNTEPKISVHGFANYTDVVAHDLVPWTPLRTSYSGMNETTGLFILRRIISKFIAIVSEEAKTLPDTDVLPVWKRAVSGVRELCDTCDTSLFNFHWVCQSCGFCICPACYSLAYNSEDGVEAVSSMEATWPCCVSNNQPHRPSGLILAQIIPANVLSDVVIQALATCNAHKIQVNVPSLLHRLISVLSQQVPQAKFQNESNKKSKGQATTPTASTQATSLQSQSFASDSSPSPLNTPSFLSSHTSTLSLPLSSSLLLPLSVDMPSIELPHSCSNGNEEVSEPAPMLCPHHWLCDGTLLCLLDAKHSENITAFQERWKRSEPVIVAGVDQFLDKSLWTPNAFERDFGDELADLVDCRLGLHLLQLPCRTFWAGFEDISVRLRDHSKNEPRLLKLKDWPPGDDFKEKLPRRYNDLMNALPLHEYTRRDGKYNMVSSLPDFFVKPDLGPKMYNAYGSPQYPQCGTTNLHLDISSAVNVMVYCNVPTSIAEQEWKLVEDAVSSECCQETFRRTKNNKVGAIWHIYSPSDADKIRALLRKVYEETGIRPPMGSDPIHDQLVYLDSDLRQRLYCEYGVKGWSIAQCVGDAIFIPAGAPHQVRNLCSCIKIAEDFVSPEHVCECLKLTEEFRQLSDHHANHEDKLQVKNIIYHSMKDIVGALKSSVK